MYWFLKTLVNIFIKVKDNPFLLQLIFKGKVILHWIHHLSNRRNDFHIYFLGKVKFSFQRKYMKTVLRKNVGFIRVPGSWVMRFRRADWARSHISLCKRKAIEWLVLFEPWELVQTSVCFRMYGVLCIISPFSLDWRMIFISLPKFGLY